MARKARSVGVSAAVWWAAGACAQTAPPDYDFSWATIGAPGNRAVTQEEGPRLFPPYQPAPLSVGAVNYEYRLTTTEVRSRSGSTS
jgi:hypothetical protein